MKIKIIQTTILAAVIIFISLAPTPVGAQGASGYQLLEPSVVGMGEGSTIATTQQALDYASFAVKTFLGLVVLMSVLMIVIGGLEYMASTIPAVKGRGLARVYAAIGGLVLALASYLILYIINPDLITFRLDLVRVGENMQTGTTGGGAGGTGGTGAGEDGGNPPDSIGEPCAVGGSYRGDACVEPGSGLGQGVYGEVPANEFEVRNRLQAAGITVNDSGSCREGAVSGCRTYVGGLTEHQVNKVIELKQACNCEVIISGAAEQGTSAGGGHSHGAGSDHYDGHAVDIRPNAELNS